MWKLAISFCLLATIASSDGQTPETYTFAIWKNQKPKCLGVAVDEKYIVTSAHCVYGSAASSLSVKNVNTGETKEDKNSEEGSPVLKVFVHPYYTPPSPDYDIALLKINPSPNPTPNPTPDPTTEPFPLALPLGKTEPPPNGIVQTIYWNPQNNKIYLTTVKIEDRNSCKNKVGKFVTGRMICAYDENPLFKSNGPLIFNDALIGIPSKRIENNQGVLPAIYTNIANSEIYSFIESYV